MVRVHTARNPRQCSQHGTRRDPPSCCRTGSISAVALHSGLIGVLMVSFDCHAMAGNQRMGTGRRRRIQMRRRRAQGRAESARPAGSASSLPTFGRSRYWRAGRGVCGLMAPGTTVGVGRCLGASQADVIISPEVNVWSNTKSRVKPRPQHNSAAAERKFCVRDSSCCRLLANTAERCRTLRGSALA